MKKRDNNVETFFALLRSGLWEQDVYLLSFGKIDYSVIIKLAEEQSLVGLIAASFEHVLDVIVPKNVVLTIVGCTLQMEQQNQEMNSFIFSLYDKLKTVGVEALIVKGQGIAQCYERPLWRACGDIDLLLNGVNYQKAKMVLAPLAESEEPEVPYRMHKAYSINGWEVELHGNMRGRFLKRVDRVVDEVQKDFFKGRKYRTWRCGDTDVRLPNIDEDIIFVFAHILQHFFIEGIGLRQICDWCRLLWTYRSEINRDLLEQRLQRMGLMTEWNVFASLAVNTLGMPAEAMPLYSDSPKWKRKAARVVEFVLETGNFGHNRKTAEIYKYPIVVRKTISLFRHTCDGIIFFRIFPLDAIKIWFEMIGTGIHVAIRGV